MLKVSSVAIDRFCSEQGIWPASYLADRRTYAKRNLRLCIPYPRFAQMSDISCAFRNSSEVVYPSRNYFTSRNESWNSCFLFYLREMEFYRYLDMWSRLPVRGKIVFSTVSTAIISFPLFPAAFQQLILESLQVFHNSDGIFASCRSLSMADRSSILHISNCDFIIRGNCGML